MNFLGALQPVKTTRLFKRQPTKVALPRLCAKGQCKDHDDAKEQLRQYYKKEYPEHSRLVDDPKACFGGIFVFDCTPYELIEKAADEQSAKLIQEMYEEAVELSPLTY